MKIITCIKQVPASSNVQVDPKTGVLIRDGNNVKMNPYDLYALEASFELKERSSDAFVHAISMGPPAASQVLYEAIYMGADAGTLISDRRFAGADVLATSYTLSQLIAHIGSYDVIICGKQTTDGDTAQVGPEIAEFLGIPHTPYVKEIIDIKAHSLVVRSVFDDYEEIIEIDMPCLLTIDKGMNTPRLPSFKRKRMMKDTLIKMVSLKDLDDQNPEHYGLSGSPTQVDEIFPPKKRTETTLIHGTKRELAEAFFAVLKDNRYV